MNLLAIIQAAASALTLPTPSAVVGSADANALQLLELANNEGRDLARRYPWQALIRQATFTTTGVESQGTITTIAGTDFRYILDGTFYNRSTGLEIPGPISAEDYQSSVAAGVTGPTPAYRLRGNTLLLLPAPEAGESCAFEYVSRNWCSNSSGSTTRDAFVTDQDLCLVDDELVLLGVMWRWRKAKGFEYSEEFMQYERQVADAMARDGGKSCVSLGGWDGEGDAANAINRTIGA